MRSFTVAIMLMASLLGTARADECPGHPGALGVSRTIVLDPIAHPRLGTLQYEESLPLNDHEVVLTFDDGPLPPYTNRVLDTLAAECVKATFFLVGRMAQGYPQLVRREFDEGHTIAGHSQNHPFSFARMSVDAAAQEIEHGFDSVRAILGDPADVSPFFRIPGLLRQEPVEDYLASRGYATWSLDFLADDWTHISAREITRRALQRIEARGRGILLLHDIQPATAAALPVILAELKKRGYKIVRVVPATPDRPATVARAEDWVQRHHTLAAWPRGVKLGAENAPVTLDAPSPLSFGVGNAPGPLLPPALLASADGNGLRRGLSTWPHEVHFEVPDDIDALPIPAGQDFIYDPVHRVTAVAGPPPGPRRQGRKTFAAVARPVAAAPGAKVPGVARPQGAAHTARPSTPSRQRPIGHQLSIARPTASL
jgi:peptidoglycan-N-acetylglucosamine deacetylase